MELLIVGAGRMARGIGTRALAGGHRVRIADRDPQKARSLAADLDGDTTGEALRQPGDADVVVLAVPYPADQEIAGRWADQLSGKTVIDIANPVDSATFDALETPRGVSAAEQVAAAAPGARVVKAFNTTFATNLASGAPLDVLIAGDDADAKRTVSTLVSDGGMRPIDVGSLKHAHALEAFQLLHMRVQDQIGGGSSSVLTFGESPKSSS